MARKRSSSFGADEGLFDNFSSQPTQQVQDQPHTHEVHEAYEVPGKDIVPPVHMAQEVHQVKKRLPGRKLGSTQGKKGEHLPRINVAFSDENHAYLVYISRRRGLSATAYVKKKKEKDRRKKDNAEIWSQYLRSEYFIL